MSEQDHATIYLEPKCAENIYGRTWCQDDAPQDCDCPDGPHPWVKFIRADIVEALEVRVKVLEEALRDLSAEAGEIFAHWPDLKKQVDAALEPKP